MIQKRNESRNYHKVMQAATHGILLHSHFLNLIDDLINCKLGHICAVELVQIENELVTPWTNTRTSGWADETAYYPDKICAEELHVSDTSHILDHVTPISKIWCASTLYTILFVHEFDCFSFHLITHGAALIPYPKHSSVALCINWNASPSWYSKLTPYWVKTRQHPHA
jgi:hypothetical protein